MEDHWSSGYVTDVTYTYGYYAELNPLRMILPLLKNGFAVPTCGVACELGFGQGVSLAMHAAASDTVWFGTDFNPSHAVFAGDACRIAGREDVFLFDDSFEEFAAREDLPLFDHIGLHGVWSWISAENRAIVADFIRRRLRPGGVLYISYNTLPGFSGMEPLRHLLCEHARICGAPGDGTLKHIGDALDFADRLVAAQPRHLQGNPQFADRLAAIREQNPVYLAHEYFNRDWAPMHFADMAAIMGGAKLTYACSAHYLEHHDGLNLLPEQAAMLAEIPDVVFRETVRDYMVNQQFRRDYWIRGPLRLSRQEQLDALRSLRFLLIVPREDLSFTVRGSLGEATLRREIYEPLVDALADLRPRSLGELEAAVARRGVIWPTMLECVITLAGAGVVSLVREPSEGAAERCARMNRWILERARTEGDIGFLASPVTGGGIPVSRFQQLFLLAILEGGRTPEAWADFVFRILEGQNQKIVKDGRTLETEEENRAELLSQAGDMAAKRLPVYRALRLID